MKKVITFFASLVLVLVVSGGAKAVVITDLGTIPVPGDANTASIPAAGAAFVEEFLFKTAFAAFVVELSAVLNANIDLTTFTVQVFTSVVDAAATPGILLSTAIQGPVGPPDFSNIFTTAAFQVDPIGTTIGGVITDGQLFVRATGTTVGGAGTGNYSVQLTVTQIPLPPAAILFLSALAGLVGFSRIRRQRVT